MTSDSIKKLIFPTIVSLFGAGTIIVCVYLFFGFVLAVYFALIAYALGFMLMTLSSIRKVIVLSTKEDRAEAIGVKYDSETDTIEEEKQNTKNEKKVFSEKKEIIKHIKAKKAVEIVKAVLSALMTVFTIVVLTLY